MDADRTVALAGGGRQTKACASCRALLLRINLTGRFSQLLQEFVILEVPRVLVRSLLHVLARVIRRVDVCSQQS